MSAFAVKITPTSGLSFWMTRMGLYFLVPPLFILTDVIITSILPLKNPLISYAIAIILVANIAVKISRRTIFEITDRSVSFTRDFIWISKKEVLIRNIKEVELKSSLLQKAFHVGTVIVRVQANGADGVSLYDIKEPDKIYNILNEAISKATIPSS